MPCSARWMPASRQGSPAAPQALSPPGLGLLCEEQGGEGPAAKGLPIAPKPPPSPGLGLRLLEGGARDQQWAGVTSEELEEAVRRQEGSTPGRPISMRPRYTRHGNRSPAPRIRAAPGAVRTSPPTGGDTHQRARTLGEPAGELGAPGAPGPRGGRPRGLWACSQVLRSEPLGRGAGGGHCRASDPAPCRACSSLCLLCLPACL